MTQRNLQLPYSLSVDDDNFVIAIESPKNENAPPPKLLSPPTLQPVKSRILIEKIDRSLGRYYSSHDRNYFDENGQGMFLRYCSANGYDDITVDEELKADPEDCMLLDFDETDNGFPALVSENNLLLTTFDIIKKCYQHHEPFKDCNFADYDFKISYKMFNVYELPLVKKINEWHSEHCSNMSEISEPIYELMAIGCEINQPYFLLLADTFSRYRLKRMRINDTNIRINNDILLNDFIRQNKHCLELNRRSGNNKCTTLIYNALKQWNKEFPPFDGEIYVSIIDHVERITELIAMGIEFVSDLAKSKNTPFQWDYSIAFNKCGVWNSTVGLQPQNKEDGFPNISTDWLADVVNGLKKHNLKMQLGDLVSKEYILTAIIHTIKIFIPTELINLICNFIGEMLGFHCNFKKIFAEFLNVVNCSDYPKRKRFCTFVDNRDPNNIKRGVSCSDDVDVTDTVFENDDIDIIFYEPPNCNFPKPYYKQRKEETHNLFCFDTSAKFILPGSGNPFSTSALPTNINSKTFLKGEMLTLSFHIQSEEEIRCYLYINGKMARFFPQDIMDFLCESFVENDKNSDFIKSDVMKGMIEKMTLQLRDERFRVFNAKHHL
eukprot:336083_1